MGLLSPQGYNDKTSPVIQCSETSDVLQNVDFHRKLEPRLSSKAHDIMMQSKTGIRGYIYLYLEVRISDVHLSQ